MITLITGVPGAGKTLYAVDQILQPEAAAGRQLFIDNIPELLIPHEVAPDPLEWPKWAPQGAHIVIDEAQRIWRPEAAGKTIIPSIAELETHRHRGLDFTILTQHPNLIHQNVRRLVGRHIHVRRTALGVMVYEWSECKANPDTAFRSALTKVKWSHPKRSFSLYKSASIHQKVKFRIPKAVWLIVVPFVSFPILGYFLYGILSKPLMQVPGAAPQKSALDLSANVPQGAATTAPNLAQPPKEVDIREQFIPRIHGEPATAPAYDGLRVVVAMPVVAACIADEHRCWCYTQQMTQVEMADAQCRERVSKGAFDPYRDATESRTVRGGSDDSTRSKS